MLKKAANITITLLLLIATGGLPVTRHYCGSAEMSFSVYSTPKACCNGHCDKCHNVFKFSKVNDNFESGSSITSPAVNDIVIAHTALFVSLFDNQISATLAESVNRRAVFIDIAGHSPASSGNFRC